MAVLDSDQLTDMRGFLGIGPAPAVFTDDQLQRLFVLSGENFNGAVYLGWLQILGGAVNWIDYKVALTQMSREAAWEHVRAMVALWGAKPGVAANQVAIVGMNPVPPKLKPRPADDLAYPRRPQRWARWGY